MILLLIPQMIILANSKDKQRNLYNIKKDIFMLTAKQYLKNMKFLEFSENNIEEAYSYFCIKKNWDFIFDRKKEGRNLISEMTFGMIL